MDVKKIGRIPAGLRRVVEGDSGVEVTPVVQPVARWVEDRAGAEAKVNWSARMWP